MPYDVRRNVACTMEEAEYPTKCIQVQKITFGGEGLAEEVANAQTWQAGQLPKHFEGEYTGYAVRYIADLDPELYPLFYATESEGNVTMVCPFLFETHPFKPDEVYSYRNIVNGWVVRGSIVVYPVPEKLKAVSTSYMKLLEQGEDVRSPGATNLRNIIMFLFLRIFVDDPIKVKTCSCGAKTAKKEGLIQGHYVCDRCVD